MSNGAGKIRPHTIIALVEDRPGVLARISGMISARGFNIDSLAVGGTQLGAYWNVDPFNGGASQNFERADFPQVEVGWFQACADRGVLIRGGTAVTGHGSDEMPVWGPIFRALDPSDARVKVRISSLVSHIASIQQR
jgi:hypothetical protein